MITEERIKASFMKDCFLLANDIFSKNDLIKVYGLVEALRRLGQSGEMIEPQYLEEILEKWFLMKGEING